jgi:hypothetical protein
METCNLTKVETSRLWPLDEQPLWPLLTSRYRVGYRIDQQEIDLWSSKEARRL